MLAQKITLSLDDQPSLQISTRSLVAFIAMGTVAAIWYYIGAAAAALMAATTVLGYGAIRCYYLYREILSLDFTSDRYDLSLQDIISDLEG